ncbi:hypothetical protein ABZ942_30240 [Nocardia sp. NPDC046473]|uniref:hypothetical protein n=1 Tax=Nocardia sp. NPDC046473 TaxID=3155733 RepID=UPI0033F37E1A
MQETPTVGTVVELHVPDFGPVREFYTGLGFEVVWERAPEGKKGYLVVQLENNVLCFWCGNEYVYEQSYFRKFPESTTRGYGVEVVVMVADIEHQFGRVSDEGCVASPLKPRDWGIKDFRVIDPFGYYLRFTEQLDIRDRKYAVE